MTFEAFAKGVGGGFDLASRITDRYEARKRREAEQEIIRDMGNPQPSGIPAPGEGMTVSPASGSQAIPESGSLPVGYGGGTVTAKGMDPDELATQTSQLVSQSPTGMPSSIDWEMLDQKLRHSAAQYGDMEWYNTMRKAVQDTQLSGVKRHVTNALLSYRRGDPEQAAMSLSRAYSFFPNAQQLAIELGPNGELMGSALSEFDQTPIGEPFEITPDMMLEVYGLAQDPMTYEKWKADMDYRRAATRAKGTKKPLTFADRKAVKDLVEDAKMMQMEDPRFEALMDRPKATVHVETIATDLVTKGVDPAQAVDIALEALTTPGAIDADRGVAITTYGDVPLPPDLVRQAQAAQKKQEADKKAIQAKEEERRKRRQRQTELTQESLSRSVERAEEPFAGAIGP